MTADGRLGIGHRLVEQLAGDLLFGDVLAFVELLQLVDVLIVVEGDAVAFAAVATRTTGLLVVAFEALGDVVVDDEAHIGLVDAHAEGDGGHDDVDLLHEELVLVLLTRLAVEAGVVGQGADAVDGERLGQFLHLLAAEAVHDARLAWVLLDIFDDVLDDVFGLGSYFVIQIRAVERRLEDLGVHDLKVFHDVVLHLHRGGGGEGDDGEVVADGVDDGTQTAVFRTEVVAPFRDAVCLVDGDERDLEAAQELGGLVFGERLGCHIEQLGLAALQVFLHLEQLGFRERRVHHMRDAQLRAEVADHVDLVFHQGDERRDDDSRAFRHQRRQLVAQ